MERLTKRGKTTHENGVCCTHFYSKECKEVLGDCAYGCKWEEEAWSKLADYEDAEENGLLMWLPCKVGDEVYRVVRRKYGGCFVRATKLDRNTLYRIVIEGEFGKTVFLTKAEAEKALAEMGV